jgi:hypothetical protein
LSARPRGSKPRSLDVTRAIGGKVGGKEAEAGDGCWASRGDAESGLRGDCWWLWSDEGEDWSGAGEEGFEGPRRWKRR